MKPSLFVLLWLILSCEQTPEPIDLLTRTPWCNGSMTYRFGSDGRFEMTNSTLGQRWSGNWLYTQARTDLEKTCILAPIGSFSLSACKPFTVPKLI